MVHVGGETMAGVEVQPPCSVCAVFGGICTEHRLKRVPQDVCSMAAVVEQSTAKNLD